MASDKPDKSAQIVVEKNTSSSIDVGVKQHPVDPDLAYTFLKSIQASNDAVGQVDLKKLRRKIDWYIVSTMFLCYTMQFIDKVSLNVSLHGQQEV